MRELCDSHVVSEFHYKPLYDDKHRALRVEAEQVGLPPKGLPRAAPLRGVQVFEDYAARWWREHLPRRLPDDVERHGDAEILFRSVDYARFKLFHLSVLWRASVARGELFAAVRLGPKHEDGLRRQILAAAPGALDR